MECWPDKCVTLRSSEGGTEGGISTHSSSLAVAEDAVQVTEVFTSLEHRK
jgi:hypothetical protein